MGREAEVSQSARAKLLSMKFLDQETYEKTFPQEASVEEQIRYLLEGATRAPSTHNSQPWKFRLRENVLEVFRDESIQLPYSDTHTQYAHVSIGFLLHHLQVLGEYFDMSPSTNVSADKSPLATVTFRSAGPERKEELKSLVSAVFSRRNRRGIFTAEPIPEDLLAAFQRPDSHLPSSLPEVLPTIVTNKDSLRRIGELTLETMRRVYMQPDFRKEMSHWVVPTGSSRKDGIPGYSLNQSFVLSWILPHLIRTFNIGKIPGRQSAAAIASSQAAFAFGAEDNRAAWISIGFTASRIILELTSRNFNASVFVATAELSDIRKEVTELCGLDRPLRFLFVAGKLEGNAQWMTPRVPVKDKLIV